MEKREIRRAVREQKARLTQEQIETASAALATALREHPLYRAAKSLYGYLSYNQEVLTLPILRAAQADGKRVAVPKVFGETMRFLWLDELTAVASGYRGIPEPIADGPEADDTQALVLLPGLAFDRAGRRIGYGGGFYDRFLSEETHPTIALCYEFQLFDALQTEAHDIPADAVLAAAVDRPAAGTAEKG